MTIMLPESGRTARTIRRIAEDAGVPPTLVVEAAIRAVKEGGALGLREDLRAVLGSRETRQREAARIGGRAGGRGRPRT